jgi:hypothetical protein
MKIAIGFVLRFLIGAGCRYFDIPAAVRQRFLAHS